MSQRLVVVVTGANGGVGLGICHRLLVQLSSPNLPDAQPFFDTYNATSAASALRSIKDEYSFSPDAGITIVLACRDPTRAQTARNKLFALLDKHIATLKKGSREHTYAAEFRKNVRLEPESLDLSTVKSVLDFGRALSQKYEYVSHLIFNAGTSTYSHLDLLGFIWDLIVYQKHAIHHPRRNIQCNGVLSEDGLGYAWQCNVFGHYVLYRSVQHLLVAYTHASGRSSRVIWLSSLDAEPTFDPNDDWQLTKTYHSYQASKYQCELIYEALEKRAVEAQETGRVSSLPDVVAPNGEIHHLLVSPGIISTNMSSLLNIWIPGWRYLMLLAFFLARLFGSPHVLMSLYAAAVASVHAALVPLSAIPTARNFAHISPCDDKYPSWHSYYKHISSRVQTLRMGSENDRWGNDRPGVMAVPVWEEHPNVGEVLLERFERLYQAFEMKEADRRVVHGNGNDDAWVGNGKVVGNGNASTGKANGHAN